MFHFFQLKENQLKKYKEAAKHKNNKGRGVESKPGLDLFMP
jgi:hypothetical protein